MSLATHKACREGSDQTRRMPRLIWVFAGCTGHFVGFVLRRLKLPYKSYVLGPIGLSKQCWPEQSCLVRVYTVCQMSHVMRKPVFGVCDQVRLKPACLASETSLSLEILKIASRAIILSRQGTTKMWSDCRFSHDVAQIVQMRSNCCYIGAVWSGSTLFAIPFASFGHTSL